MRFIVIILVVFDNLKGKDNFLYKHAKDAKGKNMTRELLAIHSDDEMDQPKTVVVYMQWGGLLDEHIRCQYVFMGLSRIVNCENTGKHWQCEWTKLCNAKILWIHKFWKPCSTLSFDFKMSVNIRANCCYYCCPLVKMLWITYWAWVKTWVWLFHLQDFTLPCPDVVVILFIFHIFWFMSKCKVSSRSGVWLILAVIQMPLGTSTFVWLLPSGGLLEYRSVEKSDHLTRVYTHTH